MLASLTLLANVVLPVFALVIIGALVGRAFDLQVRSINRLALYAVLPALAFRAMANLALADIAAGRLVLAFLVFLLAMAALGFLAGWTLEAAPRRGLMGAAMLGNAANLNLPVALFAFGQEGLDRALILYVTTALVMYTAGPMLFGRGMTPARTLRVIASFPVLWATLAGLLVNALGVTLPLPATRAVDLLADAAIPLMLLILGAQLVRAGRWRPSGRVWIGVSLKLAAAPATAFLIGTLVGLAGLDLATLVLLAAMPTAVNAVMLSIEFGGDAHHLGETVAISTATSLVTLPIILAWLAQLI